MDLVLSDRPLALSCQGDMEVIDLSRQKILPCIGCFGCWTKTPGRCVIRDDATRIYPRIAASDRILYVSRVKYGGYDTVMKTMLERSLPIQQAFLRLHHGETHHVQRRVHPKRGVILAYGADTPQEQELFGRLVARNAENMNFEQYRVVFCSEEDVEAAARREVAAWQTC